MTDELDTAEGGEGTSVSLTELLEDTLVLAVQAMAGQAIGVVDAYNTAETGADRVSITPLVPLLVAGEMIKAPKLPSVPVAWPSLGGMSLKFPLLPTATMRLSVLGHDHDAYLVSGTANVPPVSDRRFSLSDLVAVPSAPSPLSSPPDPTSYDTAWAVLFGQLKVGSSAASDFVALASLVKAQLDSIALAHDTHSHPTAPSGPVSMPSVIIGAVGAVAATKLKAL